MHVILENFQIWFKVKYFKTVQGQLIKTSPGKYQFVVLGANTNITVNSFLDGSIIERLCCANGRLSLLE